MPPASPPHRLRADAARNRRSLLDAAREVFAEHGMEASIAEIAQRAGIGKGTVFRHFATKECLAAAIVSDRLDELAAIGRTLLDATDPGAALLEFMTAGVELQARDRAFCQAATTSVRRIRRSGRPVTACPRPPNPSRSRRGGKEPYATTSPARM